MIAHILRTALSLLLALAAVLFALANRAEAPLVWSPVHPATDVPLFLPVLAAAVIGFIGGGLLVWLNGGPARAERRRLRRRLAEKEKELRESGAHNLPGASAAPGMTRYE